MDDPVQAVPPELRHTVELLSHAPIFRGLTPEELTRIAGALEPGDHVVVTEDTVTRGTSVMEAVAVVREAGAEVVLITAIVDRGGTCAALADAAGIAYRPLLTAADLGFAPGS